MVFLWIHSERKFSKLKHVSKKPCNFSVFGCTFSSAHNQSHHVAKGKVQNHEVSAEPKGKREGKEQSSFQDTSFKKQPKEF